MDSNFKFACQQNFDNQFVEHYDKSNQDKKQVNLSETTKGMKESKIKIKKLNVVSPIVFKSQEYFNTIDYGRNYIKSAINEIDRGNLNNTLEYLQTVRQYYSQIK